VKVPMSGPSGHNKNKTISEQKKKTKQRRDEKEERETPGKRCGRQH